MSKLEMLDDVHGVYTNELPPEITIEQRERVKEWFRGGKTYFK
jgi:hypothetical protein